MQALETSSAAPSGPTPGNRSTHRDRGRVQGEERGAAVGRVVAARRDRQEPRGVLSFRRRDRRVPPGLHRRDRPPRNRWRALRERRSSRRRGRRAGRSPGARRRRRGPSRGPRRAAARPRHATETSARRMLSATVAPLDLERLGLPADPEHDAPDQHERSARAPLPRTCPGWRPAFPACVPNHENRVTNTATSASENATNVQRCGSAKREPRQQPQPVLGGVHLVREQERDEQRQAQAPSGEARVPPGLRPPTPPPPSRRTAATRAG